MIFSRLIFLRTSEELKLYDKAEKDYHSILDLDKENVNAMLSLSVNYIREKKYINAEAYAKKVIKINPDLYDAYFLLGRSQQYQGLFLDAIKSYKTSISLKIRFLSTFHFVNFPKTFRSIIK